MTRRRRRGTFVFDVGKRPHITNRLQSLALGTAYRCQTDHIANPTFRIKGDFASMENRTASEIEESTERLLRDLQNVVRDGEELLRAGVQDLSEKGVAARERLAAALEVAKETRRRLEERAVAGAKATHEFVREYPYQSLGAAFGLGLLIGVLINR